MTIWQRIRITRFKYDLQSYVSHLVHSYISAKTEFEHDILTIYLIEPELGLILVLTYTLDQIKIARKSTAYRNKILSEIRHEISLGYPEIKLFEDIDN